MTREFIVPPNSKESEMMVLGCMLTSINAFNVAAAVLEDADFYYLEHKTVLHALKDAYHADRPADIHLIAEELKRLGTLETVGGINYLTILAQYAGTSAYIEEYIDELKDKSVLRNLIHAARQLELDALGQPSDVLGLVSKSIDKLKEVRTFSRAQERFPIKFLRQIDSNFFFTEPPSKEMLLEYADEQGVRRSFLPKGIVAMLVGAGGAGKTHLLAQMTISMATGMPFLDMFTTTEFCGANKRGNVFLGLGENQYDDIRRVLYKSTKELRNDVSRKNLLLEALDRIAPFSFSGQQAAFLEGRHPSRFFQELKHRLIETAPQKEGWTLIILDPISRFLGADAEIDNAAATQFIALMEELTIELPGKPTVLFAHHANKASLGSNNSPSQSDARGSSALTDGVRWQVNLGKAQNPEGNRGIEELAILKMTKSNFTAIFGEQKLKRDEVGNLHLHEFRQNIR